VVGLVQRRAARRAGIYARRGHVLVIFAREGGFGAFFAEDAELFYVTPARALFVSCLLFLASASANAPGRDGCQNISGGSKRKLRTFVQDRPPLVVGSCVGERHFRGCGSRSTE
jgi:hypothetical protein